MAPYSRAYRKEIDVPDGASMPHPLKYHYRVRASMRRTWLNRPL